MPSLFFWFLAIGIAILYQFFDMSEPFFLYLFPSCPFCVKGIFLSTFIILYIFVLFHKPQVFCGVLLQETFVVLIVLLDSIFWLTNQSFDCLRCRDPPKWSGASMAVRLSKKAVSSPHWFDQPEWSDHLGFAPNLQRLYSILVQQEPPTPECGGSSLQMGMPMRNWKLSSSFPSIPIVLQYHLSNLKFYPLHFHLSSRSFSNEKMWNLKFLPLHSHLSSEFSSILSYFHLVLFFVVFDPFLIKFIAIVSFSSQATNGFLQIPRPQCILPVSRSRHSGRTSCNFTDRLPFHMTCIFLNSLCRLNDVSWSHFVLGGGITFRAHSSIKETSHGLNLLSFSLRIFVPCGSLFPSHMRQSVSFLFPVSVNVLEHAQMICHRSQVHLVPHVLNLLNSLLVVDSSSFHSSSSQSDLGLPESESSFDSHAESQILCASLSFMAFLLPSLALFWSLSIPSAGGLPFFSSTSLINTLRHRSAAVFVKLILSPEFPHHLCLPLHLVQTLSQLCAPQQPFLLCILSRFLGSRIFAQVDLLFPPFGIGMPQTFPHHTVRLLPILFVKDSIFVVSDSLEGQAFKVVPTSFIESQPSPSYLMSTKTIPDSFSFEPIFLSSWDPDFLYPIRARHRPSLSSSSSFHNSEEVIIALYTRIFCASFPPQILCSCRISCLSTKPCLPCSFDISWRSWCPLPLWSVLP